MCLNDLEEMFVTRVKGKLCERKVKFNHSCYIKIK